MEQAPPEGVSGGMNVRDHLIHEQAVALWLEVFGPPTPPNLDGRTMLEIITRDLAEPGYDHICSPHLRPSVITRARRADDQTS